jgi:hypothetical protein
MLNKRKAVATNNGFKQKLFKRINNGVLSVIDFNRFRPVKQETRRLLYAEHFFRRNKPEVKYADN